MGLLADLLLPRCHHYDCVLVHDDDDCCDGIAIVDFLEVDIYVDKFISCTKYGLLAELLLPRCHHCDCFDYDEDVMVFFVVVSITF